jgi:RNA polymerase sigma-70 factor (ECF subfamily)
MMTTNGQGIGYRLHAPAIRGPVKTWEAPRKEVIDMHGDGNETRRYRRVMRHLSSLLRVALYLAPSRREAEKLVEDVVVEACRRNDGTTDPAGEKYALFADLTSRFLRRFNIPFGRRRDVSLYRDEDRAFQNILMEPANTSALERMLDEFSPEEVEEIIREIPADCRLLVVMSFIEGFSSKEIAGMIGVEPELIRSNLACSREMLLRKLLKEGTATMRAGKVAQP